MSDGPSIRASYLPIEHLEAELVAAPLSSMAAFQNGLVTLDPSFRQSGTVALWREVELSLLSRFPGTSIDELVSRRDRAWFPNGRLQAKSLIEILSVATKSVMDVHGRVGRSDFEGTANSSEFQARPPADEMRRMWRWLTFSVPPDLLLGAAEVDVDCPVTLSPNLALKLAGDGYAEPHLHIGAAIPFDVLWSVTQFELAQPTAKANMFQSPGAGFDEGRRLGAWLLRAAICRPLLAAFLNSPNRALGLSEFLRSVRPRLVSRFGTLAIHRMFAALVELRNGMFGQRSPSFDLLRSDFSTFSRMPSNVSSRTQLREFRELDPLGEWFPDQPSRSADFQFSRAAFHYIRQGSAKDKLFAQLFWQVIRMRVAFYRHIVQRPMTPGLQWFVRTYARLSPSRRSVAIEALLEHVVKTASPGLRSLEFRLQPTAHMAEMSDFIQRVDRAVKKRRGELNTSNSHKALPRSSAMDPCCDMKRSSLEVGIVFHFSRSRSQAARKGAPAAWGYDSHSAPDDRTNASGYRYSGYYIENRADAAALGNLVTTFPRMLEIIRGVDLCSDELGVPLWATRGLIDHVMKAADRAVKIIPRNRRPFERPMRVTVHAGEDFVHLLGGIRRVGEAIEFIPLSEGDRIGHAVALGVEPHTWARLVQTVPITLEERLLDLTWLWRLAMRPSSSQDLKTWIPWIREQLDSLAQRIFGDDRPSSPVELSKFQRALHDTWILRLAGFPSGPRPRNVKSKTLDAVIRWLTDRTLFNRAQALDNVDVRAEAALTLAAQRQVRLDIGRLGIAIEVNPSSNLLIGHMGSIEEHPLWRLRPPRGDDKKTPPVRICIGSDDPITFATNLANEYQLVFDAMTESGLSADECDAWIENVRQTGLDSRFTVPRLHHNLMLPVSHASSPLFF